MNYKDLYRHYKRDYTLLKNIQCGGNKIIIHISGASGSGKTTLGGKLQEVFGDRIIVKDIGTLRREFIREFYGHNKWTIIDKNAYQKYIDKYVNDQTKPIVFVGLNNMPWWHKNHYYNMHATNTYYIKLDNDTITKQKCARLFTNTAKRLYNSENTINELLNNNKSYIKMIKKTINEECNKKKIIKMNNKWIKDYEKQSYIFMSQEDIFEEVSKIINKYAH